MANARRTTPRVTRAAPKGKEPAHVNVTKKDDVFTAEYIGYTAPTERAHIARKAYEPVEEPAEDAPETPEDVEIPEEDPEEDPEIPEEDQTVTGGTL